MPRLAFIPLSRFAMGQKGLVRHPFPVDPILAGGHPDLLGLIVVGSRIKHIEGLPLPKDAGGLEAHLFPGKFRLQNWCVDQLRPGGAGEIGVDRSRGHSHQLHFVGRIPAGKKEQHSISIRYHLGINRPAARPVPVRMKNRIGGLPRKMDPILGPGVADGILLLVSIALIKKMNLTP